jgi:very-short-patch-repair endonuclease
MNLLTPPEIFKELGRRELAEVLCFYCNKTFFLEKYRVERAIERGTGKYCSQTCARHARRTSEEVNCVNCHIVFRKHGVELKRTTNHFCSRSCSAQYNNRRKNLGATRRSKAEEYLCNLIQQDFPEITLIQNSRTLLPSGLEVDIFIEQHKLAIELNGPIHYFPIYGESKFKKIQAADLQKQMEMKSAGYDLLVIDISSFGYFKKAKVMLMEYYAVNIKPLLKEGSAGGGTRTPMGVKPARF